MREYLFGGIAARSQPFAGLPEQYSASSRSNNVSERRSERDAKRPDVVNKPLVLGPGSILSSLLLKEIKADPFGQWPARLVRSVPVGCDLSMVWPRFALWLLTEELAPIAKKYPKSRASLSDVGALYREWCDGTKPSFERWMVARAAYADAAAYAADAAAYAADAAAYAADAAARQASYRRMADKLIQILAEA